MFLLLMLLYSTPILSEPQTRAETPSILVLYSQAGTASANNALEAPNPKLDVIDFRPAKPQPLPSGSNGFIRGKNSKPKCAGEQSFCLYDKDYPIERVHDILNTYHDDAHSMYHQLHRYSPQEFIAKDNATHSYRHRGNFVCESEVAYLRPGWARTWRDEWVVVVNTDKFPQMVRVETCKFARQKCEFLPPCYQSACVQRFSPTRLLSVDPANPHQRPIIDVFEMPVACSCFVDNFRSM